MTAVRRRRRLFGIDRVPIQSLSAASVLSAQCSVLATFYPSTLILQPSSFLAHPSTFTLTLRPRQRPDPNRDSSFSWKRGQSATIRLGEFGGDKLSVDHIIPKSIAPALAKVIANLELIPLRANDRKGVRIEERQRALAQEFFKAGLLSEVGLRAVLEQR